MSSEKVGKYFTLAEFTRSSAAARLGDPNTPTPEHLAAIRELCARVLDPLREALGRPVVVTSGYRSAAVNAAIGGSKSSDHMRGRAADVRVSGLTSREVARVVVLRGLPFDQAIWYDPERGGHLHLSYRLRGRGEVLYAPVGGGYYAGIP